MVGRNHSVDNMSVVQPAILAALAGSLDFTLEPRENRISGKVV